MLNPQDIFNAKPEEEAFAVLSKLGHASQELLVRRIVRDNASIRRDNLRLRRTAADAPDPSRTRPGT